MSGEDAKMLMAITVQNQVQMRKQQDIILDLVNLIKTRTKEHQIALDLQIKSLQEPTVLPVHERVEPVDVQTVQLEPTVQAEALEIESISVSKHL